MTYHFTSLFGHLLGARVTTTDTAAIVAYILGLSVPMDADDHLKSPNFFAAAAYTTLSFKSKRVETVDDSRGRIIGDPTTINPADWGRNWNQILASGGVLVGDIVKINIELEIAKQPDNGAALHAEAVGALN